MGLLDSLFGNASESSPAMAQKELQGVLLQGETVERVFKLHRDLVVMTNYRILTVDKQGLTGKKQAVVSIPYQAVKKFALETAGHFDGDSEIYLWLTGEAQPLKWELGRSVDSRAVYQLLSYHVLAAA